MLGWQLSLPEPRQPSAGERDDLSDEIRQNPALPHIVEFLSHAKELGMDVSQPKVIERAIEAGNRAYAEQLSRLTHQETYAPLRQGYGAKHSPLVYYMRRDTLIKIGYSSSLRKRNATINPDGIMIVEPGGIEMESLRHRQFNSLRRSGEWFYLKDDIVDHILDLRDRFEVEMSQTFEAWWAAYRQRVKVNRSAQEGLPRAKVGENPDLGDLVTAELAALAVGRPEQAIRTWVSRKKIYAVARTNNGCRLYRLSDVLAIARQVRHWHANGPAPLRKRPNGNLRNG